MHHKLGALELAALVHRRHHLVIAIRLRASAPPCRRSVPLAAKDGRKHAYFQNLPRRVLLGLAPPADPQVLLSKEREFFIDNLLVRIHLIMEMNLVDWSCAMGV